MVESTEPALEELARRIASLDGQDRALCARATRLAERLSAQRFHVAVLGDFKRGKSTLVDALIGRAVLPTGVVPLTTVATEVRFGATATRAVVVLDGDRRLDVPLDEVGGYVSEVGNPANTRGVRRVEVEVTATLGAPGLVLVDTPGVASVNEHQTAAARDALADADGAIVVLSADSPLSESEEGLLTELAERRARVFVVVNKCDHLTQAELAEVRRFVDQHLARLLGAGTEAHYVAARVALGAHAAEPPTGSAVEPGFAAFRVALEAFVRDDLAAARRRSAVAELERLAARISASVAVERAAARLDADSLGARVRRFEAAAGEVAKLFADDCLVLDHEVKDLADAIGRQLAAGAVEAAAAQWPKVAAAARGPVRHLDAVLEDAVTGGVREGFEPLREAARSSAEAGWAALAERFGARLGARVSDLRTAAGEAFDVHLPAAPVPALAQEQDRFSYLFVHAESPGTSLGRHLALGLPTEGARRRALRRARRRLDAELAKHAGRARYDLAERVQGAKQRFVQAMKAELEETQASIVDAAGQAGAALRDTEEEQAHREMARRDAAAVVGEVAGLAGPPDRPAGAGRPCATCPGPRPRRRARAR